MKKISFVTPVYNSKDMLRRTLESILRQDYPNIEHVVVDGGSSDGTIDLLKEYEDLSSGELIMYAADVWKYDSPNAKYVITDGSLVLHGDGITEISVEGIEDYLLYKCTSSGFQYYTHNIFPKTSGYSFEIEPASPIFYTMHQICQDRSFVSVKTDTPHALVYGPYSEICAGAYQVDFFYSTNEEITNNEIGTIDINIPELWGILATQVIDSNSKVATLKFAVNTDAKMAETRFFTDEPGIVVTKIVITCLDGCG